MRGCLHHWQQASETAVRTCLLRNSDSARRMLLMNDEVAQSHLSHRRVCASAYSTSVVAGVNLGAGARQGMNMGKRV